MRIAGELTAPVGQGSRGTRHGRSAIGGSEASFAQVLEGEKRRVRFSQHAEERLQRRGVMLTNSELEKLGSTIDRMREKGAREALIYMKDSTAMVVSVTNRTVITALDDVTAADSIFTNIDSAAII
ncbi:MULTISPECIES: TIGR02530 family flagellar biosynthesis protein [Selenomonas]|jgi:flagellar operon protein|uniref:TIGR02530 family flagellar biosynthesis protein n=1 Tax=Selenomonas TaxID=970 RepID=UPI00027A6014|nr:MULTISPECIES: TIGR02530 family flagellar biosynthesis protein [Selenomonas]EJP33173.1 flagellar operon protein [Selenomonas sp. FOBRC9]